ncbi:MAG: hypothetical protein LLG04_18500 [Parachlamydia sp.]|nr:hypothetical protein [Parachlamydia sp.]
MTTPISNILGPKIYEAMQRIEPLKGSIKDKISQVVQNRVNYFIDIFKTGKFTTDSQVCTLLNKEVGKLNKLMDQADKKVTRTKDPKALQEQLTLRKEIEKTTDKILDLMHQTGAHTGNRTKSFQKLEKSIGELLKRNQITIDNETKILRHFGKGADTQRNLARTLKDFASLTKQYEVFRESEKGNVSVFSRLPQRMQDISKTSVDELATMSPSTFISRAENLCKWTRKIYAAKTLVQGGMTTNVRRQTAIPPEVKDRLEALERQVAALKKEKPAEAKTARKGAEMVKLKLKDQRQVARNLPLFIKDALSLPGFSPQEQRELNELMENNLKPPTSPEEARRVGKRAIQIVKDVIVDQYHIRGAKMTRQVEDLEKDLNSLEGAISRLPILEKGAPEEPATELLKRERPKIVQELKAIYEDFEMDKLLEPHERITLATLINPKLANQIAPEEFVALVKSAAVLMADTYRIKVTGASDFNRFFKLHDHAEELEPAAARVAKFRTAGQAVESQRAEGRKTPQREPTIGGEELATRRAAFRERVAQTEMNLGATKLSQPPRPPSGSDNARQAIGEDLPRLFKQALASPDFKKNRFQTKADEAFFDETSKMSRLQWLSMNRANLLERAERALDLIEDRGFMSGVPRNIEPLIARIKSHIQSARG